MENFTFYCHLFTDNAKGVIKTLRLTIPKIDIRILELKEHIKKQLESQKESFTINSISKTIRSRKITDTIRLSCFFEPNDDIFCQVEQNLTPIKTINTTEDLKFKHLTNYSYYESNKQTIRVNIPLKDVQTIPVENIKGIFTESSCEVKVIGLNNLNYFFAVPRLHCKIIPDKSTVTAGKDNIIFRLRKAKDEDNWASLFKMRFVGETD
jgi:hypothetical protein